MPFKKILLEVTVTYLTLALALIPPTTWGNPTDLRLRSGSLIVPDKNVELPSEAVVHKDSSSGENLDKTAADAEPLPNNSASGAVNFETLKDKNAPAPKVRTKKCFFSSFYDDYYVPPPPPPYPGPFGPMYPPMRGPSQYPFF